jgi:endonuclease YncB( thermonuclease family)
MSPRIATLAVALCLAAIPAKAFTATASLHDGDTIHVTTLSGADIKIRLADLAALEIDQLFGQRSRRALCDLICGKNVEATTVALTPTGNPSA